jgi:hypothetical protein
MEYFYARVRYAVGSLRLAQLRVSCSSELPQRNCGPATFRSLPQRLLLYPTVQPRLMDWLPTILWPPNF